MKRFDQLLSELPLPLKVSHLQLGLDLGSSTTRIRVGNSLRLVQPTCAIVHTTTNTLLALGLQAAKYQTGLQSQALFKAPVRRGVITDVALAADYIKAALNKTFRSSELSLLTRINGVCIVPSQATKVELAIFSKTFSELSVGNWVLRTKSEVWQRLLGTPKYAAFAGCIDLGGDTTEIILADEQVSMAATVPLGGRVLVKRIMHMIRSEFGFQLSWESAEKILQDVSIEPQQAKPLPKVIVRGKNVTTGKPETLEFPIAKLTVVFDLFFAELVSAMQLFFAQVPTMLLTKVTDDGVLVSGGLSQMQGIKEYFEQALSTHVELSQTPQEDLIKHIW